MPSAGQLCKLPTNTKAGTENTCLRAFPSRLDGVVCCHPSLAGPVAEGRTVVSHAAASSSRSGARSPSLPQAALLSPGRSRATASRPTQLLQRAAAAQELLYGPTG